MSDFADTIHGANVLARATALQDEARRKAKDELEARQREQQNIALPSAAPAPKMPTRQVVRDEGGARVESTPQSGNLSHFGRRWKLYTDSNGKINGYGTTRSTYTQTDDGRFAVIPTIVDGDELSEQDAIAHYRKTGENWGIVRSESEAKELAQKVHLDEQSINQKAWNDFIHNNWDEVSPEITGDKGMAEEHARRLAGKNNAEPLSSKMMRAMNLGLSPNRYGNATEQDWKKVTDEMDANKIQTVEQAQKYVQNRVMKKARDKAEYNLQVGNLLASSLAHANMEGAKTTTETHIDKDGKPHTSTYRIGIAFPEHIDAVNKRLVDFGNNTVQQIMARQEIDATGRAVGEPKFFINFKMDGSKNTGGVSKTIRLDKDQVVATMRRAYDTLGRGSFDEWEKTVFKDYAKEREEENLRKARNEAAIAAANDAKAKAESGAADRQRTAENDKRKLDLEQKKIDSELQARLVGAAVKANGGTGGTGGGRRNGEMSDKEKLEYLDKEIDGLLFSRNATTGEVTKKEIKPGSDEANRLKALQDARAKMLEQSMGVNVRPSITPEQAKAALEARQKKQTPPQTVAAPTPTSTPTPASTSAPTPTHAPASAPTKFDNAEDEEQFQRWLAGQPEKFRDKNFLAKYDLRKLYQDVMTNNAPDDVSERLTAKQGYENLPTRYIIGDKARKDEEVRRSKAKHDREMAEFQKKSDRKTKLALADGKARREASKAFNDLVKEFDDEEFVREVNEARRNA